MNAYRRLLSFSVKPVYYESVRNLRSGVTIPVKTVKKPKEPPKPRNIVDADLRLEKNIGIGNQLRIFVEDGKIDEDIDEDTLEDTELGFDGPGKAYDEHVREVRYTKKRRNLFNVWRKHFREPKMPNMLTYAEKEQIRYLHNENPDEWTPEKLSNSFPATPHIIQKILKVKWKASDVKAILTHDRCVERNWELFKQNKLDIPPELASHLYKFSQRKMSYCTKEDLEKFVPKKSSLRPQPKEFGKIIESYKELKGETSKVDNSITDKEITLHEKSNDRYILEDYGTNTGLKHRTLENLKTALKNKDKQKLSPLEEIMIRGDTPPKPRPDTPTNYIGVDSYAENTKVVSMDYYDPSTDFSDDRFPLRIDIPDNVWKKGMVYRVRDRFYDDQGLFLYRVPGLVS